MASKKGTTEAALLIFNDKELNKVIENGILAANARAEALGKSLL